ncbi:MAG TPA: mannose-1-phosphate guanylyltransferase [Thermoanaerobaculia bacterium]|nr:mannose-1-phosphate guanylyltransferase [Thermoanaerobaculia bacterium]
MRASPRAVLLLAGGSGTRLWPLSTEENPKQFLRLFGGESLLEQTWKRMSKAFAPEQIFISTHERYCDALRTHLPEAIAANILPEPDRRNTAPAIACCVATITQRLGAGTCLGVFPSDHSIGDEAAFLAAVERAFERAAEHDELLTIGLTPTEPNTGFGYLEVGDELAPGVRAVLRFVEKPDRDRAEEMIRSGRYLWNGGMFVWRGEIFREALARAAPEIEQIAAAIARESDPRISRSLYQRMPSVSIDYALMEKAEAVATVPGDFGWSDVGSWSAVASIAGHSPDGALLLDADQVYVQRLAERPVVIIGLDRIAVIESPDGLLVLNLDRAEALAEVVRKMGALK